MLISQPFSANSLKFVDQIKYDLPKLTDLPKISIELYISTESLH